GGLCGQSIAPSPKEDPSLIRNYYKPHWLGFEYQWTWGTLGEFLGQVEKSGVSVNFGMFVGHTTLRLMTMGFECRPATSQEIASLKRAVRHAMADGAFGLSSGLQWQPGFFCDVSELIELGKVVS